MESEDLCTLLSHVLPNCECHAVHSLPQAKFRCLSAQGAVRRHCPSAVLLYPTLSNRTNLLHCSLQTVAELGGDPWVWACLTNIGLLSWTMFVPDWAEALCPIFLPLSFLFTIRYLSQSKDSLPNAVSPLGFTVFIINLSDTISHLRNCFSRDLHTTSSDTVSFLRHDGEILLT